MLSSPCDARLPSEETFLHAVRHCFEIAWYVLLPLLKPVSDCTFLVIAKHMRKGRQEDSHEFLRYAIDALQKSCLAGYPQ